MKPAVGNIIAIPVADAWAVGKILYISSYFKNVMLIKIYKDAIAPDRDYQKALQSKKFELFYTGTNLLKNGQWETLGNDSLTADESKAATRVVGGEVWYLDECVRPATEHDMATLGNMRVYNVNVIEGKVAMFVTR